MKNKEFYLSRICKHFRVAIIAVSILLVVLIFVSGDTVDNIVLLENRNPGFIRYLSDPTVFYVRKDSTEQVTANFLVSTMESTEIDGITISANDDGTLLVNGSYNGHKPTYIYPNTIDYLPTGDYILSDGNASTVGGLQVRFWGVNTRYGGITEYGNWNELPNSGSFFWNPEEYEIPRMDIVIYPGFNAENLLVKPMLRKASDKTADYQIPVRILSDNKGVGEADLYFKYATVVLPKQTLKSLNSTDWQLFQKSTIRGTKYDWVTVDFEDGTGIEFDPNNPSQSKYGEIDNFGRVHSTKVYGGIKDITIALQNLIEGEQSKSNMEDTITTDAVQDLDLTTVSDFNTYLQVLKNSSYSIFLVINGDGVYSIDKNQQKLLQELGISADFFNHDTYYKSSYISAVIPGKEVYENVSTDQIEKDFVLEDGTAIKLLSIGDRTGDSSASIFVNGEEKCVNRRGMNLLVYDTVKHLIVDSVCFDTHSGFTCTRVTPKYR